MRIVFLDPSGELGGAETALLDLLAALRTARPDWTLDLIASADGPLVARAASLNIHSTSLTFPPALAKLGEWGRRGSAANRLQLAAAIASSGPAVLRYVSRLRRELASRAPDIVHSNGLKMHLLGARALPPRSRLMWHLHDYPGSRPMTAALLRRSTSSCAAVLANSDSVARDACAVLGPDVSVRTLYNSIDLDRFHPAGETVDLDAYAGLPAAAAGSVRIGLVATFARWKGHEVFLDAIARLKAAHSMRAYIIGGPIYTTSNSQFTIEELRRAVDARGLTGAVGLTGPRDDVPSVLRSLDIVVHASVEREPFGLVIAEAMACGRALVASRAGGAAEIAEGAALFHSPGNAAELAQCLDRLLADAALRASIGRAGREAACRLFGRRRLVETLVPIYQELAAGSTRESSARP